jgi:hypothetical protein
MIATPHLSICVACVSGTLHPGDEIRELDGESVENKSIESLQSILVIMRFVLLFSKKYYSRVYTNGWHLPKTYLYVESISLRPDTYSFGPEYCKLHHSICMQNEVKIISLSLSL